MRFLEVFNEIEKGNYALTDESVYASIQNGDEFISLYGGNKDHRSTDRRISVSAKTLKGTPITVFTGEGIIISLDGSAGSMTYKNNERFALNHHAGFITAREDATERVNLEFFAIYLQNFYRNLSVSDGSKTLSLGLALHFNWFNIKDSIKYRLIFRYKKKEDTKRLKSSIKSYLSNSSEQKKGETSSIED